MGQPMGHPHPCHPTWQAPKQHIPLVRQRRQNGQVLRSVQDSTTGARRNETTSEALGVSEPTHHVLVPAFTCGSRREMFAGAGALEVVLLNSPI